MEGIMKDWDYSTGVATGDSDIMTPARKRRKVHFNK